MCCTNCCRLIKITSRILFRKVHYAFVLRHHLDVFMHSPSVVWVFVYDCVVHFVCCCSYVNIYCYLYVKLLGAAVVQRCIALRRVFVYLYNYRVLLSGHVFSLCSVCCNCPRVTLPAALDTTKLSNVSALFGCWCL